MIENIKLALSLLGLRAARRNAWIFPDDTLLVSYPRSGSTWLRFAIANLLYDGKVDFTNIGRFIPDIYAHSIYSLLLIPRPRVLKSHEHFDKRYKRVIYLVRDPRKVAIYYYYYLIKRRWLDENITLDKFVDRFSAGEVPYGSWINHLEGWMEHINEIEIFLLIRYEDLLQHPERELLRIANTFGWNKDLKDIKRSVANSSFEKMKELESVQSDLWIATKGTRKDIMFVREGPHNNGISSINAEKLEQAWSEVMERTGYL